MPRLIGYFAAAAMLVLAPASLAGQPGQPESSAGQQPSRWHLDGATSRCVLSRRLAGDPVPATFILRTIPGSGRYDLILASPDLPSEIRRPRSRSRLTVSLHPAGIAVDARAASVELTAALGEGVAIGPFPADFLPAFERTASLALSGEDGREIGRWAVPAAARAAEAVSYCEAEKLIEWGADPAGFEPGATRPQPAHNSESWLTPRQLGLHDIHASFAYTAVYRLALDADGRVSECTLLESAGNVDLGHSCQVLTRAARYTPARDATGNAIRSVAIHLVSFRVATDFRIVEG